MAAKLLMNLKDPLERFCRRFPLFSMVVLQTAMAIALMVAVGAIAAAGGTVIWIVYRAAGLM